MNLIQRVVATVHEETILSVIPPRHRNAITIDIYNQHPLYDRGHAFGPGGMYDRILPWEQPLFSEPPFPRCGRILLGAAGAGRELNWLCQRGYVVSAFEPSALVHSAREVASAYTGVQVEQGAYSDLVAAIDSTGGPLSRLVSGGPFDGIVLGWGSLSHVWDANERVALFRALRTHSPKAPVAFSFLCASDDADRRAARWLCESVRSAYRIVGAPGKPSDSLRFSANHGFGAHLTRDEIDDLSRVAGYSMAKFETVPYPHALFVPA